MNRNAAFREPVNPRLLLVSIALLLSTAMVLVGLVGTASAAPLSKDGKIYACYKVKGKPKGAMRIVRSSKARCKRGERKVAWNAVPVGSQAGTPGQAGSAGQSDGSGSDGSGSNEAALKTEVAALSMRLEALEGVLAGVTNGDLKGMLGTLQGLDNEDLVGAVNAVPVVDALCEQTPELVDQVNGVGSAMGGLVSVLNGTILGPIFGSVSVPAALDPFSCP